VARRVTAIEQERSAADGVFLVLDAGCSLMGDAVVRQQWSIIVET
jgi:hypothetical protein